jgi:glycosyltransferase involved in cell wall biosynthesis
MIPALNYFYRHPDPIYFSVEKLFSGIGQQVTQSSPGEFLVTGKFLPYPSKLKTLLPNILFTKRNQGDINHITGDVHYAILGCHARNINILTIHDCVMLRRLSRKAPRYWVLKWLWYDLPVRKADAVTVISESTRQELLRFTNCDPKKIRVIPNFVGKSFQPSPREFNVALPRILFIGSTPNKNLERLILAIEGLRVKLDIVGILNDQHRALLQERNIDYFQSSGLTPEALQEKYMNCDLLAFPSTYEGFGLPVIEAQAIGRPVLTSDLSPLREISGGAAHLVDPYDETAIRQGMIRIIGDADYRRKMIADGFENVKRFQLDSVAQQYISLYKELIRTKKTESSLCVV